MDSTKPTDIQLLLEGWEGRVSSRVIYRTVMLSWLLGVHTPLTFCVGCLLDAPAQGGERNRPLECLEEFENLEATV